MLITSSERATFPYLLSNQDNLEHVFSLYNICLVSAAVVHCVRASDHYLYLWQVAPGQPSHSHFSYKLASSKPEVSFCPYIIYKLCFFAQVISCIHLGIACVCLSVYLWTVLVKTDQSVQ